MAGFGYLSLSDSLFRKPKPLEQMAVVLMASIPAKSV
jgi:hypothetical protein